MTARDSDRDSDSLLAVRPNAVPVLVALLLLLLGLGGAAAHYKLVRLPREAARKAEQQRLEAETETRKALDDAKRKLAARKAEEARQAEIARLQSQAEAAEKRGDLKVATGHYQEAAKHEADVSSKLSSLERAIARRDEAARRQAAYDDAVSRARSYAGRRQWKEAASACREALRQKPGDPQATRLLAEAKESGFRANRLLDLGGGVTMEFMLIPAGEFMMGSPGTEKGRAKQEGPQHRVRITKPFYIGKCEVTQEQYQAIMGTNPSKFKGASNPVETVSWNDASEFCRKLSQRAGRTVRLPTEAEWEYACRAGSTTRFCFGESDNGLGDYAWHYSNSEKKTHPVGGKQANAWGLHDMHGNVWEWCGDWKGSYPSGTASDPTGPTSGRHRVLRGGSWRFKPHCCRSAFRGGGVPTSRDQPSNHGFRVAVVPSSGR